MAQTYTVGKKPRRIDQVAKAIYGTERSGTVEQLLDANPGLALQGPFLAIGTVLTVPAVTPTTTSTFVPPWT